MGSHSGEPSTTDAQPAATDLDPTARPEPDHGMPAGPYAEPVGAVEAAGAGEAEAVTHAADTSRSTSSTPTPGGSKELLKLALPLDRQPELHDGAGVRGHRAAVVARPAGDDRVVPRGHVVLAVLRRPAGHRGLHLHVRRAVHRREPAAPRRPGGVAGDSLRGRRRAALPRRGAAGAVAHLARRAPAGARSGSKPSTCSASRSRRCRCS